VTSAISTFAAGLWPTRTLIVAELDAAGTVVAANEVVGALAGEDPLGRPFAALAAPNQRQAVEALLDSTAETWTGLTVGLAPDENGVPVDFELWARRDGERTLVVAEPHVHGIAALNSELLRLNDELIGARREAARAAESERSARGRAEAAASQLRHLQRIVDTTLTGLSLAELLDELLGRVCDAVGADALEALLLDELAAELEVRADRGLSGREPEDRYFPARDGLYAQTLRAGRPLHVPRVGPDSGVSRALAESVQSLVSVPLRAESRALGVLAVGSRSERVFTQGEIEMLELAAERIAVAIERVLAFERERTVAAILQDSLMPGDPPELDGLEVATRYRPAGMGQRVGGDFYDVFPLPDGRSAAVVGDVRGKGPEAAARTALVRFTVRALAPREPSPAALLTELNRAMLDQSDAVRRHCTIVYATFRGDTGGAEVELACGGHPPPLVLRTDGSVEEIGLPGSLVGLLDDVTHRTARARLEPGDVALFYTDGVTESHRSGDLFGEERLAAALAGCAGLDAGGVADRIERAVEDWNDGPLRDDVAIVAVRAAG
jgi:serine phosphatase RsbU (regulator of sigma subunit)